jgi:choline dehydrogenase-like flavoprotein
MIADLSSLGPRGEIACDVCVIGAGAAGVTVARELLGSGLEVCLLESGGLEIEPELQALSEGESVGAPVSLVESRVRAFGGSTWAWTGRCATLDPIDFEPRDWVAGSGWPIRRAALDPYYRRAAPLCGFLAPWTEEPPPRATESDEAPREAAAPSPLVSFMWRYAPLGDRIYMNFGKAARGALGGADRVRTLLHATVTGFEVSPDRGRIVAALAQGPDGASARITARAFALCCGGVANAALLLHGARTTGAGFGNETGQLGRCFHQHPRGVIATVEATPAQSASLQKTWNIFRARDGVLREIGWALSEKVQRDERLLNASVIAIYHADPNSGWESAKAALGALRGRRASSDLAGQLGRAGADLGDVAQNALRRARGEHAILKTKAIELVVDLEQVPEPDSRVVLSERTDRFGLPLPRVDWRIAEAERRTAARFAALLKENIEDRGLGQVRLEDWLDPSRPLKEARLAETYHHLGATRMSADPATGVVDADCKVHGMANVYVAGGSVFPTGGHANPTFTIVALALRLADHLKATLRG